MYARVQPAPWRRGRPPRSRQRGFLLVTVVLFLGILAAGALLLASSTAMDSALQSAQSTNDRLDYVATSALAHAEWALGQNTSCTGYTAASGMALGEATYEFAITPSAGSPVQLSAQATVAGVSRQRIRSDIKVYPPSETVVLQPGPEGKDNWIRADQSNKNHATDDSMHLRGGSNEWLMFEFDLDSMPENATIQSAVFELSRSNSSSSAMNASIYGLTRSWTETGATWDEAETGQGWTTPGGDYDALPTSVTAVTAENDGDWQAFDVRRLVSDWVSGARPNYGFIITADGGGHKHFATGDEATASLRPKLTIIYACECGLPCNPPGVDPDLIAHWKLDDGTGIVAVDSVGGHDGALVPFVNGPSWTTGAIDGALEFDEFDDYVQVPDFSYGAAFTISFTFKVTDNSGTLFKYVYSHGNINATNSLNVFLTESSHGTDPNIMRTVVRDTDDSLDNFALQFDISAIVGDGDWHTYTLSVSDGIGASVYLDGILRATDVRGGDAFDPTGDLFFGTRQDLDPNRLYRGTLDEVRIYGRALSEEEVAALVAESGGSVSTPVPVGESSDPVLLDDGRSCDATVRDQFNTISYSNQDGTLDWTSDWIEINESNGPTLGDERVRLDGDVDPGSFSLRVQDNDGGGEGVEREVDLSGFSRARLVITYRRDELDDSDDVVSLLVSGDGGKTFEEFDEYKGDEDGQYQQENYNITDQISSNTVIRLISSPTLGNTDRVYFSDITICLEK